MAAAAVAVSPPVKGATTGPVNGQNDADTQPSTQQDDEWESGNSTAKLFERSRIKALAGTESILHGLLAAFDIVYYSVSPDIAKCNALRILIRIPFIALFCDVLLMRAQPVHSWRDVYATRTLMRLIMMRRKSKNRTTRLRAEEREGVQKKTFTKWCNSHLERAQLHVDDLYIDLRDGKYLIKLLEILSGERLVCIRTIPTGTFSLLYFISVITHKFTKYTPFPTSATNLSAAFFDYPLPYV